jgi:hypothetical protein
LFSTTNGWPNFSCSLGATERAIMSVDPPGGKGTSSVTGFDGHDCAWAPEAAAARRSVARMFRMMFSGL